MFRLGEDLSRARSDTRRAATAAKLIRQAYESLTDEDEAADVAPKVLQVVLGAIHADYAVLWRREGERWIELSALGNAAQEAHTLTLPPDEACRFAYASAANPADEGTAAVVAQAIGYPYLLGISSDQGMALAAGATAKTCAYAAFEEADEEMISSVLSVFCDLHRRKLRSPSSLEPTRVCASSLRLLAALYRTTSSRCWAARVSLTSVRAMRQLNG